MLKRKYDPLAPPPRWLNCPRKSDDFIADKFLAFKTPLSNQFDQNVPIQSRFTIQMLLNAMKSYNKKLGLVIDLTNTSRFYDAEKELKERDIKYVKIKCSGHDETPNQEQTKLFINTCDAFQSRYPLDIIGVHCTHGFNRTGFMICSYLVEKLDFSIDAAIMCFARSRPPGIYKQDYINELFKQYASPDDEVLQIGPRPDWDDNNEEDDEDDETSENQENVEQRKKRRRENVKANPEFAAPINGVEPLTEFSHLSHIQRTTQEMCKWDRNGFPGSQPVSMDMRNLQFLETREYKVSWKADGTRYLMLIQSQDKIFMLDRDNSVFRVCNLTFPKRKDLSKHVENTLLDGEFVMDLIVESNEKVPRFLIYDIIKFEGQDVGANDFNVRYNCIQTEIINVRNDAIRQGKLNRSIEPFSIRRKDFYYLNDTKKLLSKEFEKTITHGMDGLIFQPVKEPYVPGMCDKILKWKPPSMNSVDFKLIIRYQNQIGVLQQDCEHGELYVNGFDAPYATIKLNKKLRQLGGKIIECTWNNNTSQWEFMRERVDKSFPNAVKTAISVCESIRNPVTEEKLLHVISRNTFLINRQKMPPPNFQATTSQ